MIRELHTVRLICYELAVFAPYLSTLSVLRIRFELKGTDSGKTVHLKEREVTSLKIEVVADGGGTVKNYFIHVSRLSFSDASLSVVELSAVSNLYPKFAANVAR